MIGGRREILDILGPGGSLARAASGWEARPGQVAMAERVAQALLGDERLLIEAGTGTGKTLAYLVPAILSGRKVVISTGTKTLQDQIASIDLPRLARVLPRPFSFAVMKGLGNYVCRRRFGEHAAQLALLGEEPPALARVRVWLDATTSGDRADLPDLPEDAPVWRDVQATPETRIGPRCRFFETCYVTNMRRRAAEADVVVANHHLFLADLALRSRWPEAQVLPPYEAVIFDEAHDLADIATEFFGLHVSTARLAALARDLGHAPAGDERRAASLGARLRAAAGAMTDELRARLPAPRPGSDEVRVPVPDDLWTRAALARYHDLDTVLEDAGAWMARLADLRPDDARAPSPAAAALLGGLGRRAESVRDELSALVGATRRDHVRWIAAGPRSVSLRASPLDVGPALRRAFDEHPGPVVFTSATLTVAGSFDFARTELGLGDAAAEAAFASPFRYDRQALLYVASDLPDPGDEAFPVAAAARAAELCAVTDGRALLLFTSFRNLRIAETALRKTLPHPLLVQGERPRHVLLAELRARVGSVLLATQSFWEGVDVPGEALSLVVIDKLPFAVPDDPLVAARVERIREEGGDAFGSFQLPRAAIALKQGFGRLVRSSSDNGIVAILDGRILRKHYGATLLASLPRECPRTEVLEEVRAWWRAARPAARDAVTASFTASAAPPAPTHAAATGTSTPSPAHEAAARAAPPAPTRDVATGASTPSPAHEAAARAAPPARTRDGAAGRSAKDTP